jgi:predicted protein tyrosine phosphatase
MIRSRTASGVPARVGRPRAVGRKEIEWADVIFVVEK